MTDALRVQISPPEHGWIDVLIAWRRVEVRFAASYSPRDSVAELAAALLRVTHADGGTEVDWNQEPDQMRLRFHRRGTQVELGVDAVAASRTTTLLAGQARADEILMPFREALDSLRAATTDAEYEAHWHHPFPHAALDRLAAA